MHSEQKADLVFYNGNIYTVDQKKYSEAVAISGSKYTYIGDNETAKSFIGPNTKTYNLDGKMVLPGFVDSHAHPTLGVSLVTMARLFNLPSTQACVDEVMRFGAKNPDMPVIYGIGWSNGDFPPPEGPGKESLDAVISDRPVSIWADDGHAVWVNSKALEVCGVTKDTLTPAGGAIVRDPETGIPSGTFRENAMDVIFNRLQPITIENMKQGILAYAESAAKESITTVHDALLLKPEMNGILMGFGLCRMNTDAFSQLATDKQLTLRVRGSLYIGPDMGEDRAEEILSECNRQQGELFQINSSKIFLDGVIEGHTGYMLEPYCDMLGCRREKTGNRTNLMKWLGCWIEKGSRFIFMQSVMGLPEWPWMHLNTQ